VTPPGTTGGPPPAGSQTLGGGGLFHGTLQNAIAARAETATQTAQAAQTTTTTSTSSPANDAALTAAVKSQLDRGTSLDDVITQLASSLATSVAAQLGITPQAALQRLTTTFTQALQPSGAGPPGTNAERAATLVSAFRRIAGIATRVANGDTGQPIRTIAAQRSDAEQAKANAAPATEAILRDASSALAVPATAAAASPAVAPATPNATPNPNANAPASAVPVAASTASDGRTVALDNPALATATGGDTLLGRIIARAVLPNAPAPNAAPAVEEKSSAPTVGSEATTTATMTGTTSSSSPALDAFVTAFASALARDDERSAAQAAPAVPSANGGATTVTAAAAVPAVAIPQSQSSASITPPAPAPTLPQPQHVDPNAVIDQMLRGISISSTDGTSTVRLRLVPETLGDVSVKLIVSGGAVDASITAHTAEAQNALAGAQSQLAKSFADAGLKLSSFNVGLAGGGFADARDQSRSNASFARASSRRIGGAGATHDEDDETSLLATSGIGPPIYSARTLPGAFNHLA